jgi:protein gp37
LADGSAIEWTEATWNPVTGCDRVSPGCAHCYALTLAARLKAMGNPRYQRDGDGRSSGPGFALTLHPDKLDEPLRWRRPRMVFVNSMSDLFHERVPDWFVRAVFDVMRRATQHTFQILTKRPERMPELLRRTGCAEPLPNVWLGTSIENRRFAYRADHVRSTPAAVRFISAEPLLGPLVVSSHPRDEMPLNRRDDGYKSELDLTGIDWLIVGGESGPRHRPVREGWVRDLRDAAVEAGTAFFFKQWGGRTPKAGGRELDGRTWDEFPTRPVTPP